MIVNVTLNADNTSNLKRKTLTRRQILKIVKFDGERHQNVKYSTSKKSVFDTLMVLFSHVDLPIANFLK